MNLRLLELGPPKLPIQIDDSDKQIDDSDKYTRIYFDYGNHVIDISELSISNTRLSPVYHLGSPIGHYPSNSEITGSMNLDRESHALLGQNKFSIIHKGEQNLHIEDCMIMRDHMRDDLSWDVEFTARKINNI